MPDVCGKLRNAIKMTDLSWDVLNWLGCQSKCQKLVICEHMKLSSFYKMPKIFDNKVNGKQFSVKSTQKYCILVSA